jgi:hypothetical protein
LIIGVTQEYVSSTIFEVDEGKTKADYKRAHPHISYALMTREIDRGKIAVKLDVDGKIKLNVAQADDIFGFTSRNNLFA